MSRGRKTKPEAVHTGIAIGVESYDAHVDAAINHNVYPR